MQILCLFGMYFDAVVVDVRTFLLLFRFTLAILCLWTESKKHLILVFFRILPGATLLKTWTRCRGTLWDLIAITSRFRATSNSSLTISRLRWAKWLTFRKDTRITWPKIKRYLIIGIHKTGPFASLIGIPMEFCNWGGQNDSHLKKILALHDLKSKDIWLFA